MAADNGGGSVEKDLGVVGVDGHVAFAVSDELQPLGAAQDSAAEVGLDVVVGGKALKGGEVAASVGVAGFGGKVGESGCGFADEGET